ncbi:MULTISPECIES: choline kinase family protein [unclassified Gemella]|uniref:choline kinase family protein n=1 Tax=unclassified Gemella TaxID=2624949 RepID=UPI001C058258|nr:MULTISPECIES: choline kinase family protein [unclassified Gemella]MBU0278088.1 phosphotransferase [Gemella sp. zg-1178]QWQ38386.1 phosphotransferase [Gemella sp. zg-570]
MKIEKKIENILNDKIINTIETSYGITNKNYIVETNENSYFCRIPKDTLFINNKENEKEALDILKNEDYFLEPVYYDSNLLITQFQKNAKTFISNKNLSSIVEISKILKSLHKNKFQANNKFNPVETFEKYLYQVENFEIDIEKYLPLVEEFKELYTPDRLCHNDLVEGNFLFTKSKIYLIDFEYAGQNDYYFDIASFISENDLNYQETVTFLQSYFGDEICDFEKLDIFLKFEDLLWYTWAWLLYEKRGEEIYKTIAEDKFNKLKKPRKIIY